MLSCCLAAAVDEHCLCRSGVVASLATMSLDAVKLQAQVRANSAELASYLQDLHSWEKDIKQKEHSLQTGKLSLTKQPKPSNPTSSSAAPIRSAQPPVALPSTASSDQQRFAAAKDRGNALYAKGDYHAAIAEYNQCAILLPLDPLPLSNRAQCWLKLQQWSEADRDCSAALELDATNVKALYRRAMARRGLGRLEDAATDADRCLAIEPVNKPALQLKREVLLAMTARAGGGAVKGGVKGAEQPRRKLVIEEEAEDDEEDEEEVFPVKRGSAANSQLAAARDDREQASASAVTKRRTASGGKIEEEMKTAPMVMAARSDAVDMEISSSPAASQPRQPVVAAEPAQHNVASSSASSAQLLSTAPPSTSAALSSSVASSASSSAASLDLRVPRSALDFDSQYRRVRQQPSQLAVLLQLIPAADYPSILRTALDSSLLASIVKAVHSMQTSVHDTTPPPCRVAASRAQQRTCHVSLLCGVAWCGCLCCVVSVVARRLVCGTCCPVCLRCLASLSLRAFSLRRTRNVSQSPLNRSQRSELCSQLTMTRCCAVCVCACVCVCVCVCWLAVIALSSTFSVVSSHSPAVADSAAVSRVAAKYGVAL